MGRLQRVNSADIRILAKKLIFFQVLLFHFVVLFPYIAKNALLCKTNADTENHINHYRL